MYKTVEISEELAEVVYKCRKERESVGNRLELLEVGG